MSDSFGQASVLTSPDSARVPRKCVPASRFARRHTATRDGGDDDDVRDDDETGEDAVGVRVRVRVRDGGVARDDEPSARASARECGGDDDDARDGDARGGARERVVG